MDKRLEAVINHEDKYSKNLNKVFESYGCETLEAKVPIVENPTFDKMKQIDEEQQLYATLALKSESASAAVRGRRPKTRNTDLQVVELNGQLMISTGQVRDRSPVDRDELDSELDSYMKEAAKRKALRMNKDDEAMSVDESEPTDTSCFRPKQELLASNSSAMENCSRTLSHTSRKSPSNVKIEKMSNRSGGAECENKPPIDEQELDIDLDYYMKEAARLKAQKQAMSRICPDRDIISEFDEEL